MGDYLLSRTAIGMMPQFQGHSFTTPGHWEYILPLGYYSFFSLNTELHIKR